MKKSKDKSKDTSISSTNADIDDLELMRQIERMDPNEFIPEVLPDVPIDITGNPVTKATLNKSGTPDRKKRVQTITSGQTAQTTQSAQPTPPQKISRTGDAEITISLANVPKVNYPPSYDYDSLTQSYCDIPEISDLRELKLKEEFYPAKSGFLAKYIEWAEGTSDSPRAFHVACALAAIAHSLGRNAKAEFLGITPNCIMLLIGESGDRKSRAMELAVSLLDSNKTHGGSLASSGNYIQKLHDQPELLWYIDEADTFFQVVSATANAPTADLAARIATTFTGADSVYSSLGQGDIKAKKPCPTILMGSAVSWLKQRKLSPTFLRGGLFARMWIIPSKRTRLITFPHPPQEDIRESFKEWLSWLKPKEPIVVPFSREAKAELSSYQKYAKAPPELMDCGVWTRSQASVVKLSILYHACLDEPLDKPIDGSTVRMAIRFVHEYLMPGYLWILRKLEASQDQVQDIEQRIIDTLEQSNKIGVAYSVIMSSYGRRGNAEEALANLYGKNKILFYNEQTRSKGRPKRHVMLKKHKPPPNYILDLSVKFSKD